MPTNVDGIPGNVTAAPAINIASSTNANPIQITVSGSLPADFLTGVLVHVSGHSANVAANGVWVATVTGASTFTIPVASIGVAGGATGIVQPLNLTPFYQVPSDGDLDNNASISTWAQTTGDRTQFLAKSTGQFKLAHKEIFEHPDITGASWAHIAAAGLTSGTIAQLVSDGGTWGTLVGAVIVSPNTGGVPPVFALEGVVFGDLVVVRLDTTLNLVGAGAGRIALYGAISVPGPAPAWPGAYAQVTGASMGCTGGATVPVSLCGGIPIGTSGNLYVQPVFYPQTTGSQSMNLSGDALFHVDIWRSTGMPQ
jgi:hypothetical protein